MNKKQLHIAAVMNISMEDCTIVTASSEQLLLKELEDCFSNEKTFKTKKDVEKYLNKLEKEDDDIIRVEYQIIELE